jgi:hypothetical protein
MLSRLLGLTKAVANNLPALLLSCLVAGCATVPSGPGVEEVHLFGVPSALNLDSLPGPDGVGVRIYASTATVAKGLPIRSGVLEVLMFDSPAQAAEPASNKPRHVWSFTPGQLKQVAGETSMGLGYRMALPWGTDKPAGHSVTVIARYLPRNGKPIYSAPSTIALTLK